MRIAAAVFGIEQGENSMKSYAHQLLSRLAKASLVVSITLAGPVLAAQAYPTKPVKIVIPFTPGGSIDTVIRKARVAYSSLPPPAPRCSGSTR
jgi:hypothetical protein